MILNVEIGEMGDSTQNYLVTKFEPNNIVTMSIIDPVGLTTWDYTNYNQEAIGNKYTNVFYVDSNTPTLSGQLITESHTCGEIYDHSLGYCPPEFCNYNPESCPESQGYKYVYGRPLSNSPSNSEMCILKNKVN
tara:strand:- start:630 stop:1031 length:402 start_codon:yes stop_codon:yes gene_type:complete